MYSVGFDLQNLQNQIRFEILEPFTFLFKFFIYLLIFVNVNKLQLVLKYGRYSYVYSHPAPTKWDLNYSFQFKFSNSSNIEYWIQIQWNKAAIPEWFEAKSPVWHQIFN